MCKPKPEKVSHSGQSRTNSGRGLPANSEMLYMSVPIKPLAELSHEIVDGVPSGVLYILTSMLSAFF